MRHALRGAILVVLSYLIQASLLSYFKINGVMIDLMTITVYTIGYAYGFYAGIISGMSIALIVEVCSGDPGGLSVVYVAVGYLGAWLVRRMRTFTRVGNRTLEQNIKRFAPMVFLALLATGKESVYLAYFYLTGMDVGFGHVLKVLFAGLVTGIAGLVLIPLTFGILRKGVLARIIASRRARREEKARGKPIADGVGTKKKARGKGKGKGPRKKGAQGAKESFLSMLNPVLEELNDPAALLPEDEPLPDGVGLTMEDMLGLPPEGAPPARPSAGKDRFVGKPMRRELTEEELSVYKRPPKERDDLFDEEDLQAGDDYPDDEPPEGGTDA